MDQTTKKQDQLLDLIYDHKDNGNALCQFSIQWNGLIYSGNTPKDCVQDDESKTFKNFCEVLGPKTNFSRKFRAYHSGSAFQSRLASSKQDLFEGLSITNHIFFSTSLEEVVTSYLLPSDCNSQVIYVTDLREVKDARIQTSYESEILWNDKIRTLIQCYKDPQYAIMLSNEYPDTLDYSYIKPFKNKPPERLREAIIQEIQGWIEKHTIPFSLEDLNIYKKKNWSYILIPEPIKVKI